MPLVPFLQVPSLPLVLLALQASPPAAPAASTASGEQEQPRGLQLATTEAFDGYTLFSPLSSRHTHLVDMQGREVHRWTSESAPSAVYLLDDGSILRCARIEGNKVFKGGGICGRIERIGWDGDVLWSYELANEDQTHHHDARPMPNGNVLLITWEFRYREDCLAAGRDPVVTGDGGLWPDAVLEVKPTLPEGGEVVWEWHAWDHLVQDRDPEADFHGVVADHPERLDINFDRRSAARELTDEERRKQAELEEEMRALGYAGGGEDEADAAPAAPAIGGLGSGPSSDWLHTNAIDYDAEHDLIALSSPNLHEVWIIDHSTTTEQAAGRTGGRYKRGGEILWRWGNPQNYGAGTAADQRLFFQHNVQWIRPGLPGAGNLLVFNNGQGRPGGEFSSVDELVLPFDAVQGFTRAGRAFGPEAPVWSYSDPAGFYGSFISGCQRLPNGNTLICEGPKGRVFEVTRAGKVVWDYWNEFVGDQNAEGAEGKALFRAARIAPDHPGLAGRTLAPLAGAPAER